MRCEICGANCETVDRYCFMCGTYLKEKIDITTEEQLHKNNSFNFIGALFSFFSIFIVVLALFIYFFSIKSGKLYLHDSLYTKIDIEKSTSLYGYYKTSVDYNTIYNKENINNLNDGQALIQKHANEQKHKCQLNKIKEIENKLQSEYKITAVNLCEIDVNIALEIESILNKVFNEFPEAKGYMTNLTLMNPSINDTFIAAYIPIYEFVNGNSNINDYPLVTKSMLILNSNYFLNYSLLDNTVKKASEIGYFPKNANGVSVIAHELGHYISFVALLKDYNVDNILIVDKEKLNTALEIRDAVTSGSFAHSVIKEAYQNYMTKNPSSISETDFCAMISDYAVSSIYDETIAEAVHDYILNDQNASDASLEIIHVLKEKLGG